MAEEYSLDRKIERHLLQMHGIKATVQDGTVTVGNFTAKIIVASVRSLAVLAARIKAAT